MATSKDNLVRVEDFSKMKFERLVADVEEKDVSKALEDIASNQKAYSPLKKKRKSKIGSQLTFSVDPDR
mgnify:CR=1 FL=1